MDLSKKEITDYFRTNIFEAYAAYNGWKIIMGSRSIGIVEKVIADRYVEIQAYHRSFFPLVERAFLVQFVMLSLHAFDRDTRSFSLYKVDDKKTKEFIVENKDTLDKLLDLRNKLFAHRQAENIKPTNEQYKIPSINDLDKFFKNIMEFYNKLTSVVDDSGTNFQNAEEIKYDLENLFKNIYRGEHSRKIERDIEWGWEKSQGKISEIL